MSPMKLFSCGVLLISLALTSNAVAQSDAASQSHTNGMIKMASMKGEPGERNERHPAIRAAIGALERAKADLKRASHDFGGHREAALDACDKAIEQLHAALNYDKK